LDIRQLRYFAALAEEKHFGRAAKRLAMSQPPLSMAIRQLESELQTPLFNRNSRNVELTRAGTVLQREAWLLLRRLDEAKALVKAVADGKEGRLRVGFGGSMLYRGLPEMVDRFRKNNPGIELLLQELNSVEQVAAIKRDEIDFGFVLGAKTAEELNGFRYHSEPFVACLPERHPYAQARTLDLARLRDDEFVLFSRAASPHYFESIVTTCLARGFMPNIKHEVRHWTSVVSFVESGMGVSLVPRTLSARRAAAVKFVKFSGRHEPSDTWCVWKDNAKQIPGLGTMIEVSREQARRMVAFPRGRRAL
jgi:DNA-binding transcriptional LysR family regulator